MKKNHQIGIISLYANRLNEVLEFSSVKLEQLPIPSIREYVYIDTQVSLGLPITQERMKDRLSNRFTIVKKLNCTKGML